MAYGYPQQQTTYPQQPATPYTQTLADALARNSGYDYAAPTGSNWNSLSDIYAASTTGGRGNNDRQGGHGKRADPAGGTGDLAGAVDQAQGTQPRKPGSQRGRDNRQRAVKQTIANLLDILNSHGATDPAALNRQIQGIQRGTEANQGATQEQLAATGLSGSGVGQAIGAAQGQAGVEGVSQARADEAARAVQRKREDLLLTLQLILNPRNTRRGQSLALEAAKYGRTGSNALGSLGSILGGVSSLWKTGKGGTTAGNNGSTNIDQSNLDYSSGADQNGYGGYA